MKLDAKVLRDLTVLYQPKDFMRVTPWAYAATPLGMGFGLTRFASTNETYKVLYLGSDLTTSVAEAIVRDRFQGKAKRAIEGAEINLWGVTAVTARSPLALIDLRSTGLVKLGVSTEAARGKAQSQGRKLSQVVHDGTDFDGFLYQSRLTSADCVCVFERAVPQLSASPVQKLIQQPGLIQALTALEVALRTEQTS